MVITDDINHDLPISAAKSLTNIIFLVDTSGSMSGEKIEAVNTALQDSVPFIREFGQEDESVKVQCSVLYFNKYADWATKGVDINNFCWPRLESCEGSARLDLAYMELFLKLTRKQGGLMEPQGYGQHVPIIILVIGSHVIVI